MKIKVFIIALVFLRTIGNAQDYSGGANYSGLNTPSTNSLPNSVDSSDFAPIAVKGSRYMVDEAYHKGQIWTTTGHYSSEMLYRYDQLEGTVQVKLDNGKEILMAENDILMCHIEYGDKKVIFVQSKMPKSKDLLLLQVVYYGSGFQLLRDSKKEVYETTGIYKQHYRHSYQKVLELRNDYHYFISKGVNNPIAEIEIKEKSLCKIFPSKCSRIAQFFKSHKSKEALTLTKVVELMEKLDEKSTPSK